MKRIFQRVQLLDLERTDYHTRKSLKIAILIGFLTFFLCFLQSGFSQPLNNFNRGSEPEGFGKIHGGADFSTLQDLSHAAESSVTSIAGEIEDLNKANKLAAEAYLKKLPDRFKYENFDVRCEMLTGNPAEMLAEYATKTQPDLILISTPGRSGPSRWVWGSGADRLLRAACVPVLMVRAPGCFPGI
jgi:nucleotide-binding universal stress UspA family protein